MSLSIALPVTEPSQVGEARRLTAAAAQEMGMGEEARGKLALVVTELATNLFRHGGGGELVYSATAANEMDVLALDRGPGMANVAQCLRDGYSTAGSSGTGLGATSRLANEFDIHSVPGLGTAVFARVREAGVRGRGRLETGAVTLPKPGEAACGDAWSTRDMPVGGALMVVDGLGHGVLAAEAAAEATRLFAGNWIGPADYLQRADGALRKTRGAAVALAHVDLDRAEVRYAGVGNIAGTVITAGLGYRSLVSHNGTVGVETRKIQEFVYSWESGAVLVMHSDGLASRWRLEKYPGLVSKHPSLIAGVLYRDYARGGDDLTVVVARARRVSAAGA